MAKYRQALPQLADKMFLSDGGIETTFIFHDRIELPANSAVHMMRSAEGRAHLRRYFRRHAAIALANGAGFLFESPTWRASPDWADQIGVSAEELGELNRASVALMTGLRRELQTDRSPMVLSGCLGPRGDGYTPSAIMSAEEAEAYHAWQVENFRDTEADMVAAITMNYVEEAIGIARAANAAGMPSAISFTVETDGRLPTGQPLGEAIEAIAEETGNAPAYYMINCAHPSHFSEALESGGRWVRWIRGLRANASMRSHAELDEAPELDEGDPIELGSDYRRLLLMLPQLTVLGGCCGTDHRHIEAIASACIGHGHLPAYAA